MKATGKALDTAQAESDLELARRCVAGDAAAQRELFREHRTRVHRTLYRILGSNRDIEDLIQDAFIEVFKSLASFRGEAKLSTWITRITARVAMAYIGRRKPQAQSLEALPPIDSGQPSAEELTTLREASRRLYQALERVDKKHRVAFALHVIEGLPLREVAAVTESSLVATKSRVWRARREIERRAAKDPLLAVFVAAGRTSS